MFEFFKKKKKEKENKEFQKFKEELLYGDSYMDPYCDDYLAFNDSVIPENEVKNASELGKEIKNDTELIPLDSELAKKVKDLKALNKVLVAVIVSLLSIIVTSLLAAPSTAGTSTAVAAGAVATMNGLVGAPLTGSIIGLVSVGGISAFRKLFSYSLIIKNGHFYLKKRG